MDLDMDSIDFSKVFKNADKYRLFIDYLKLYFHVIDCTTGRINEAMVFSVYENFSIFKSFVESQNSDTILVQNNHIYVAIMYPVFQGYIKIL